LRAAGRLGLAGMGRRWYRHGHDARSLTMTPLCRVTPDPLRPHGPRNNHQSSRRQFLKLMGAAPGAAAARFDARPAFAQGALVKIGVVAIRAGIAVPVDAA